MMKPGREILRRRDMFGSNICLCRLKPWRSPRCSAICEICKRLMNISCVSVHSLERWECMTKETRGVRGV